MIRVLSTFTGIGGFELGLQRAIGDDFSLVGFSEIDKYAIQTFTKNFGEQKNFGDISKISISELPDFDLLTGGFPCQDVSVAGRQELTGGRTVLVEYLLRMLEEKQPKYFVFENVKGILQSKFSDFLGSILQRMRDAGYIVNYQLLNTKEQGLPQNRERVYFVGLHKGKNGILTDSENGAPVFVSEEQYQWFYHGIFPKPKPLEIKLGDILEEEVGEEFFISDETYEKLKKYESNARIYTDIAPTLNTMQGGHRQPKIYQIPRGKNAGNYHEEAPTVTGKSYADNNIVYEKRIRKLTPIECERLQGFPDNWTEGVSKSQRYKQCGNAVSVVVAEGVLKGLLKR